MNQFVHFVENHWVLWLAFFIILLLILINEFISKKHQAIALSPSAAIDMINHENAVVIDIRDKETFNGGHIIDAIQTNTDDFTQNCMDKYKSKPIILVCMRGLQSQALATKLRRLGFTKPMSLAGGISAWQSANLPLIKSKASTPKTKRSN